MLEICLKMMLYKFYFNPPVVLCVLYTPGVPATGLHLVLELEYEGKAATACLH